MYIYKQIYVSICILKNPNAVPTPTPILRLKSCRPCQFIPIVPKDRMT